MERKTFKEIKCHEIIVKTEAKSGRGGDPSASKSGTIFRKTRGRVRYSERHKCKQIILAYSKSDEEVNYFKLASCDFQNGPNLSAGR